LGDIYELREMSGDQSALSSHAQSLIDYYSRKNAPRQRTTAIGSRADIKEQFEQVFELIGGVPRLALWADENPTQFYGLFSKLIPASVKADMSLSFAEQVLKNHQSLSMDQLKELTATDLKAMLLIKSAHEAAEADCVLVKSAHEAAEADCVLVKYAQEQDAA
jgi:hypothetical protein